MRRLVAGALVLAAGACTPPRSAPGPAPAAVRVALVDSVPYETEMHDGFLRRVEVRTAARVDTIPHVLTPLLPIVAPDGTVMGFDYQAADLVRAFAWDPARRSLRPIELPDDADRWFTTPAFSPDGRHLAYVALREGFGRGMVRRGARGRVVVRTDPVEIPATDAAINFARWTDAQTFEIYLDVGETGWHRFTGTVAAGVVRNDTVAPPLPESAGPQP
jgi:hypothetical protein